MLPGILIIGGAVVLGKKLYGNLKREMLGDVHSLEVKNQKEQNFKLTSTENKQSKEDQQEEVKHQINLSLVAVGLTTAGSLFFPFLSVLSVPLILYVNVPMFKQAYNALVKERRLRATALDSIAIIGSLATGYYFASAFATWLYFMGQNLLIKTADHSMKSLSNMFDDLLDSAWVLSDGVEIEIPVDQLKKGILLW